MDFFGGGGLDLGIFGDFEKKLWAQHFSAELALAKSLEVNYTLDYFVIAQQC